MNTSDLKDIPAIAVEDRRMTSVRCMEWVDALVEDLDRRAALADRNALCQEAGTILREVAMAVRQATEAVRGIQSESAPTGKDDPRFH